MKVAKLNDKRKQVQRTNYKAAVLNAFDALLPAGRKQQEAGKPQRLDTNAEVRRKARQQL